MTDKPLDMQLAVNPMFVPLKISENKIEFRVGPFAGSKHSIKDNEEENVIGSLIEYLDGTYTVQEIITEFGEEYKQPLMEVLENLIEEKIIVDVTNTHPDHLWSYCSIDDRVSEEQIDRLEKSSVGIITRGQIGKMVATDLAKTGVKEIHIIELSDKSEFDESQSDQIKRVSKDNLESLVSTVDYAIYADESPSMDVAKNINQTAVESNTTLLIGQLLGVEGIIGPTIIPGQSPCLQCLLDRWRSFQSTIDSYHAYIETQDTKTDVHLPAHSRLVAGFLSKEATTHLLTGHGYLVSRTVDINLLTMSLEANELLKMPRCNICGVNDEDWQRLIHHEVFERV